MDIMIDGIIQIISLIPIQHTIFTELAYGKSLSRYDLVVRLKNPRTTIYDNLVKLQKKKLVKKFSKHNGIRGRPVVYWFIPKIILKQIQEKKNELF